MKLMTKRRLLGGRGEYSVTGHAFAQSASVPVRLRGKIDTVSDECAD